MTQAGPEMARGGDARNSGRGASPASPSLPPHPLVPLLLPRPSPAVALLLRLVTEQPGPDGTLAPRLPRPLPPLHVEAAHAEADTAMLAAGVTSLASQALAYLASRALCAHLAEGLWGQVEALDDLPPVPTPYPDRQADERDRKTDEAKHERAFGTGPFSPEGRA